MTEVSDFTIEDGVGVITISSPPVNALSLAVRQALAEGFALFLDDDAVEAVVLICDGRTFFAGADISEFGRPIQPPLLRTLQAMIEAATKPVVAAIHGAALGGGFELALVCTHRVATPSAKVGLPEVKLGLIPGAGGTQRLPRIVGAEAALDLIGSGRPVGAREALSLGLVDALASEDRLRADAIAFARSVIAEGRPWVRVRDRQDRVAEARARPEIFSDYRRKNARAFRGFKAQEAAVQAVEAAVALPFDEGMAVEVALMTALRDSPESAAQRKHFFAERDAAKIPDIPPSTPTLPIQSVGVVGAGTMGGGIAMTFLDRAIPVTLVEADQAALDRGVGVIRGHYEAISRKGRLTSAEVDHRMALITPALTLEALADVDLAIEAVFEDMAVKQAIFSRLDAICKPSAILASNTSFLDLDAIAAVTSRPERVVGLHFFSPANVMRLLEVVRGARTSVEVIATVMALAKTIGKTAVHSRVGPGFIANRLMKPRSIQAEAMVLEGCAPAEIDKVIYDFGFAMGHFAMMDLIGLDVTGRDAGAVTLGGAMVAANRLGQKNGAGYYDYDADRRATPSPAAAKIIAEFAARMGRTQRPPPSPAAMLARLLYPIVNEGAKLLDEGVALRASDIDVAAILGYNWPVYTGGPMYWADRVGLPAVVAELKTLEADHGSAFTPSPHLVAMAASGAGFYR